MDIRLCKPSVVIKGLTWNQVQDAIRKAEKTEANEHFHFFHYETPERNGAIDGFHLLAMPRQAYEAFLKNPSAFIVTVDDDDPSSYQPSTTALPLTE
jgi:hypothetical protein